MIMAWTLSPELVERQIACPHPMPYRSPMVSEKDIYRAAHALIQQHGETANVAAAQRIDELDERSDREGVLVWKRIKQAVEELQNTKHIGPLN